MKGIPVEYFELYGDDAGSALAAMANAHPNEWAELVDTAMDSLYRDRYGTWLRSQIATFPTPPKQSQLFDAETLKGMVVRKRLVLVIDGARREFDTEALAGDEGAEILEAVAARDARPARTSIKRSKQLLTIAKAVRAASLAEGRPVSVAEVLGIAA